MTTLCTNKRSMSAVLMLFAHSHMNHAFSPSLPRPTDKQQALRQNHATPKVGGPRNDILEYRRSLLHLLDLDSADGFAEGEELAKELYENIKVREFRDKLTAQEEQETNGESTVGISKTKPPNKKDVERKSIASETLKAKRVPNREFVSNQKNVKLEQDGSNERFSPFPSTVKKEEASKSKSSFFALGSVFDIPSSSSSGGGQSSAVALPAATDTLEGGSGVISQMGFVLGFLAFYLFVGINGGTLKVAEEAVAGMNSNAIETVLDQGMDTSAMLGLDAASMFDAIL